MQKYNNIYNNFSWDRPERYNFARDVIDKWADEDPEKLAIFWIDDNGVKEEKTFLDISRVSCQLSNVLTAAGVKRGEVVIVMLGRTLEWWESFTACLRMGAVFSPGTTQLSEKDLSYRINAASATCVITDKENAPKLDNVISRCPSIKTKIIVDDNRDGWVFYKDAIQQAAVEFDTVDTKSDDEALCYFTSGTTGFPKMCIHSHSYAIGHQTTGMYWLDLKSNDLHWNISDTGWAKAAWSSYFGPWYCGAALFIHHATKFSAPRILEILQDYPITTMCGAPTIYRMLEVTRYILHH